MPNAHSRSAFDARFADILADANSTPLALLEAVADQLRDECGLKLVTVTQRDTTDGSFLRLYSSMPDAYATSGRKPPNETPWSAQVIDRKQTFLANDYASLAAVMADHEQIRALGCESIVNIPLVLRNAVIGTLNCLAGPGHFDSDIIRACEAMRLPVATALLLYMLDA
ncbi:GAF domain-containing protein [Pelagibacterium xiamenense]|uniref:GAF domain-containing protein n=1 Tax=Pelagibacterium xiamenense TaxID=2901140 RepID=UPI001E5E27B5|nr:GAF domain-containing protein [Pelagibacterium xiamenense]MCD7061420.1 GAF domain-containing protein [Pelagibacterium xiamenense]